MFLDNEGRELVRAKHYGFLRPAEPEYVLAEPPAAEELELFDDAIGTWHTYDDDGHSPDYVRTRTTVK